MRLVLLLLLLEGTNQRGEGYVENRGLPMVGGENRYKVGYFNHVISDRTIVLVI